jgi:hypothetical protein
VELGLEALDLAQVVGDHIAGFDLARTHAFGDLDGA